MSIKVMAKVYELAIDSDTREILLALADHADEDGYSVYPSVARLAWKIGDGSTNEQGEYKNVRTVQRRLRELIEMGALVEMRPSGYHRATEYALDLDVFPKKEAFKPKGDNLTPSKERVKGDKKEEKGDKKRPKGDRAVSPEPSLNVSESKTSPALPIEKSNDQPTPYATWEATGLQLSPYIAERLKEFEADYTAQWLNEAIRRAARVNKRNIAYIEGILKRWLAAGGMDAPIEKESRPQNNAPLVNTPPRWVST